MIVVFSTANMRFINNEIYVYKSSIIDNINS